MCLSDYEIKLGVKNFQKHSKTNRLEFFDYYKIGLINFFKGNYIYAYTNFKRAYSLKLKDAKLSSSTKIFLQNNNNTDLRRNSTQNLNENYFDLNNYQLYQNHMSDNIYPNLKTNETSELNIFSINNNNNNLANIAKWLAFSGIIILFCEGNKIDFKNILKIKLEGNEVEDNNANFLLNCCSTRKKNRLGEYMNFNTPQDEANNEFFLNNDNNIKIRTNSYLSGDLSNRNLNVIKHDLISISREIEHLLKFICKNEKNAIEGFWLSMLISIYCEKNKYSKYFQEFSDPKFYIKKIKNLDDYLSYIAYSQMMYITKEDFKIDLVLLELIEKFENKYESYYFYCNLLYKGKFQNLEKAFSITEILLKIITFKKFDENCNINS